MPQDDMNAAQASKPEPEPESDAARLVAARNRALKDAWERDVIGAPEWYDQVSTEDAVLDALKALEDEDDEDDSP